MKALLFLTSILLALYTNAQTDQIERWEDILKSDAGDSIKFITCINLYGVYYIKDMQKTKLYAERMLVLAKRLNKNRCYIKAYQALAGFERINHNYDAVIPYLLLVLQYEQQDGNPSLILAANLQLARDYLDGDMPAKALPFLTASEELSRQVNDSNQAAKVRQTFGWYYSKTNQHKKAVDYFYSALHAYAETNNQKMVAECKVLLVQPLLLLGETDSVPALLFSALNFYKQNNSMARQAYCYGLLGECYFANGFAQKGVENYLEAKRLYRESNSKVDEATTTIDLARHFLSKKEYEQCEKYAKEADKVLNEFNYVYGIIMMKTLWGQYFSEKGNFRIAEKYFSDADKMAVENALPELKTDNEKYWAEHRYRQKNYKGADSLMYSYAQKSVASKEPEVIANELETIIKKNHNIDSNTIKVLSALYSPGGVEALKKQLGKKSLFQTGSLDSILKLNPFSMASPAYDSTMSVSYNRQLLQMETQFRTRLISDSLKIAKQNAAIDKENLSNRNITLTASLVVAILLATGLWLQYRSRRRAEQDKAEIELLQNEIHHRVKNNLGVISRLVDVAGKNAADVVPLSALKNRIKSIELLHNHLYSGEVKPGHILLQSYFEDLCMAVAATYQTAKHIQIKVNASAEIDSHVAEKVGLIINELITNSYKYAFEGMEAGYIHISAHTKPAKGLKITVEDNGVGFDAGQVKTSYGMKLIRGLSNELNGRFAYINNGGTRFTLEIPG